MSTFQEQTDEFVRACGTLRDSLLKALGLPRFVYWLNGRLPSKAG